ncbi:S41 family peptidase [Acinetobacter rudis]|uniref:S41 family peptidase n=1 Tax=Acinetobacter rudis TaxID=632955 RepID=A0AAW8J663_9GAMM|nr:S41 family peptidase [Acinetobacter rudis]MDQ8934176.1 S41 family peptidase [Acinetobacter rudis]MDQ8952667.1 S41 family peptidase [Acinetobacter rudis]MDQ9016516.1 S41 family peptidase [Acinetobacter rudis]
MAKTWKYIAVLAGVLASSGHVWAQSADANASDWGHDETITSEVPIESIEQFVQIFGVVKENYVVEKSDDALFLQAIKGLVGGLDRYSRYLMAEEYKDLLNYTEADIATVDFQLNQDVHTHQWSIKNLKTGSDADKLGLSNGLVIYKIDNHELKNLNSAQVDDLLHGAMGSSLQLQVSAKSSVLNIIRTKKIEVADIEPVMLNNQVLVLKIKVFQQDTANEVKRLIDEYPSSRLKAILIDLRNNPGGLLSAAVETADLFLDQGVIVSTKSRSEGNQQFQALPGSDFPKIKLGILINGRSASAAEVFTAALKEHNRAWVMGEKSYGKGVVQKLFPLANGAALQMTVSHYFTPNGSMIDGKGIQPNQEYVWPVEMKEETYLNNVAELLLKRR